MKLSLYPPLRHALLAAIAATPCLTAFLASCPFTSEARIWTYDDVSSSVSGNPKDYYKGGIKDKDFTDITYSTDTNDDLFEYASSFGGAAIAISYFRYGLSQSETVLMSFHYDGIENTKFTNNHYIAKGLLNPDSGNITFEASGGAVLIADCVVGNSNMPISEGVKPSGVQWGINDCDFEKNTISATEKVNLSGGALSLYSSGSSGGSSTLGEDHMLESYLYQLTDNTFSQNGVMTTADGRGGAIAFYDTRLDKGPGLTMGAINEFGMFHGGITGNTFNNNVVFHTGTETVVMPETPPVTDSNGNAYSYVTAYEHNLENSNLVMGGAIYANSGTFNSNGNSFTGNRAWSASTAAAIGGAIALDGKYVSFLGIGNLETINTPGNKDFFNSNIAYSQYNMAIGGAIADLGTDWIPADHFSLNENRNYASKIVANFDGNFAVGKLASAGGAVYMTEANYYKIAGHFSNNVAISSTIAEGGAIGLEHSHLYALLTSGRLGDGSAEPFGVEVIDATFSNNSVSHTGNHIDLDPFDMGALAEGYGGAISLIHNFTVNTLKTEMKGNSVTADLAYGGALHLRDSRINYIHSNTNIDTFNDYKSLILNYYSKSGDEEYTDDQKKRLTYAFSLAGVTYEDGIELNNQQKSDMIATINANLYDKDAATTFDGNRVTGVDNAYGGAISLERSTIRTLAAKLSNNSAVSTGGIAYGGAIFMQGGLDDYWNDIYEDHEEKVSTIEYISGLMSGNSVSGKTGAFGGAIALTDSSYIYDLLADFTNNSATTTSDQAAGGAIALFDSTKISTLNGEYSNNSIQGADAARGGAIVLFSSKIDSVKGYFHDNYITDAELFAAGGAISLYESTIDTVESTIENNRIETDGLYSQGGAISLESSTIKLLSGTINSNSITGDNASGGAIMLDKSSITTLSGTLNGNSITGDNAIGGALTLNASSITTLSASLNSNSITGNNAKGGALALLNGSTINSLDGDATHNYIQAGDRSTASAMGAAIYNEDSSFTFNSSATENSFINNEIRYSDGSIDRQFLYNTVTSGDKKASATFNAIYRPPNIYDTNVEYHDIYIYDAISGSEDFVDSQFIYINSKTVSSKAATVYLSNTISNQTVIVENGTLDISTNNGYYDDEIGRFENSHLIINSKGNSGLGMELRIEDNAFDSRSTITNNHGVLHMYASEFNAKSLINNNKVYQFSDLELNTLLSSSSTNLEDAGVWYLDSSYQMFTGKLQQGYRLSLGADNFISEDSSGSTTYGKQQFVLEHNFHGDLHDLSQLTFDSIDSFEELLLNDAISINLDFENLTSRDPSQVKWTFAGWEKVGGTLSEEARLKLEQLLQYSFEENSNFSKSDIHIHQSKNGLTLTFSETLDAVVDAEYQIIDEDPDDFFQGGFSLKIHSYDQETATLSASDKRIHFEDTLGDDINLTSPNAEMVYFSWTKDTNGMITLSKEDSGFIPLNALSAYTLGNGPTHGSLSEYHTSYVGVERNTIFINLSNDITYMNADFVGNITVSSALFNYGSTIDLFEGDFVGNTLQVQEATSNYYDRGALRNAKTIGTINGDFILNRTINELDNTAKAAHAGAISNTNQIDTINGDFISNYAYSSQTSAYGGAIVNTLALAKISDINGKFYRNFAQGQVAHGGAIYDLDSAGVSSVTGLFDGNYALAQINRADHSATLSAAGGAVYREGVTGESEYKADFIANFAKAHVDSAQKDLELHVAGGAIYNKDNSGAITSIEGNFYGNFVEVYNKASYYFINEGDAPTLSAVGGAIANIDSTIANISADFVGNYTRTEVNSLLTGAPGATDNINPALVAGGAIYNENADMGILALNRDVNFEGNRTIFTRNLTSSDEKFETITFNAIYNAKNSTISLNSYGSHQITVNDGISGESSSRETQILDINSGRDGAGVHIDSMGKGLSTVQFNNSISDQTINVHAGTLVLGEYTGRTFTMADGSSFETTNSSALLINSKLTIMDGARVEGSVNSLGQANEIIVEKGGTLAASAGGQKSDIHLQGGTIEVSGYFSGGKKPDGSEVALFLTDNSGHSYITSSTQKRSLTENTLNYVNIQMGNNTALTLSDLNLYGLNLDASLASQVLMDHVTLRISNASFTMGSNKVQFRNGTIDTLTISAKESIANPTGGYFTEPMAVYTLTELDIISDLDIEGRFTLDLGDLQMFNPDEFTAFRLTGISDLGIDHGNVFVRIKGVDYQILGETNNGMTGVTDLYLYIPEPSTASLSLLALAGLLARRRRKAA